MPRVLAIETSCDETSVAVLSGNEENPVLEAHITLSHAHKTQAYGGIVPEIVAREHLQYLEPLIAQTLAQSQNTFDNIDLVAATCGPGLMGGLVIGATTAKTIALARNIPFLAINHLEGHALSPRLSALTESCLTESPPQQPQKSHLNFPYLLLLVSGGHCQLLLVEKSAETSPEGEFVPKKVSYQTLGQTRDDSAGECLDKGARLLQLPEASGAAVEKAALKGNPNRFAKEIASLPQPMRNAEHGDLSFSGLKSALARALANRTLSAQQQQDGAAALQKAVFDSLAERSDKALRTLVAQNRKPQNLKLAAFAVAGGVACNQTLYAQLKRTAEQYNLPFFCPRIELCTDNAAMIAYAALVQNQQSQAALPKEKDISCLPSSCLPSSCLPSSCLPSSCLASSLAFPVRPRWSLLPSHDHKKAYRSDAKHVQLKSVQPKSVRSRSVQPKSVHPKSAKQISAEKS